MAPIDPFLVNKCLITNRAGLPSGDADPEGLDWPKYKIQVYHDVPCLFACKGSNLFILEELYGEVQKGAVKVYFSPNLPSGEAAPVRLGSVVEGLTPGWEGRRYHVDNLVRRFAPWDVTGETLDHIECSLVPAPGEGASPE